MAAPILEVRDLHKRYGATVALAGVSFAVAEGEMFGLLGPNGAGKTTLLSILSCLLPATSGGARILGRRLVPSDSELRRQIGIVPQEVALYGDLTARENLVFFGKLYGVGAQTLRGQVDKVLAAVGLEDSADRRVHTFSGGMKRRLNLGAGLVHQPRLLLLDEPTVGVDPQSRNRIFEEVRRLNAAGVTVVYTSHYMEEAQALCPRIGIIDHGRLIACDTLPKLLQLMEGRIGFRVPEVTPALRERLKRLSDARLKEFDRPREVSAPGFTGAALAGQDLELECRDVKATLLQLIALLNDLSLELIDFDIEEPNLERVFLHLTGRGLRD
jgi:ABC-2 type transport system ATP-binding protein